MAIAFPVDAFASIAVLSPPPAALAVTIPETASIPVALIVTPDPTFVQNAVIIPETASIPEGLIVTAEPTFVQNAVTIPASI